MSPGRDCRKARSTGRRRSKPASSGLERLDLLAETIAAAREYLDELDRVVKLALDLFAARLRGRQCGLRLALAIGRGVDQRLAALAEPKHDRVLDLLVIVHGAVIAAGAGMGAATAKLVAAASNHLVDKHQVAVAGFAAHKA